MDKTLGTASVVTAENVADLFQEMIHPHLEEERERGEEAVKQERQKGLKRVKKVKDELAAAKAAEQSIQTELDEKLAEDREAVEAVCTEVEGLLSSRRRSRRIVAILIALIFCVPLLLAPSSLATWASLFVALLLGYLSITGNKLIGTSTPAPSALGELEKVAKRRHIWKKLEQFDVTWDGGRFTLVEQVAEQGPDTKGLL